ncbi:glycine cleavage T C-terminal barrel domain-containing protein [Stackebrandtia nassauensis]|uniref:Glycine cleavage T protein (Aminomethyl transferase) n=1 Tax=Stackebrandtia nassauensis (strain DSM 44728 / CIP 108903 / NRRL B-16338 / NBRC 102104 / LLR-40K-21) TaxID=446470 RepID=D3PYE7_STANL|nr:glycine cleavage T C-terminal barrel domain-containing protein [Stackebrandtia nassauensis]ADD41514.1 glycine cleavage T protein (aminomethyl transferase) [Stackebrandtia nassauensis DSM 44728]
MSQTMNPAAALTSSAAVLNPEIMLYTRLRKSPYFWKSREHGVAMYSVYNHTYHPRHYGDPVGEYWSLLNGVTIWDVGVERQVEISGPDAFAFTNMLVPRDLSKCKVGQCKYVFITAPDGGIINDPVLLRLEENRFWLSLADSDVELWALGLAHAGGWNVEIKEIDVAPIQIQGPKSRELMIDLFGKSILDLPYYYLNHYTLNGMEVVVSRTGYTAEIGYEIYLYNADHDAGKLWDTVWQAGEPHGLRPVGPCHIRRIEAGMLAYGCDITRDTNPMEVGYDYKWMVDVDQESDFIGKAALKRIRDEGISRIMCGVEIDGDPLGSYNDGSMIDRFAVYSGDGGKVGEVTSACYSPRLERNIGLAMLDIGHSELGTKVGIVTPGGPRGGVVVPKPFIDPRKETPKG